MPMFGRDDNRFGGYMRRRQPSLLRLQYRDDLLLYSAKRYRASRVLCFCPGSACAAAMMWFDGVERFKLFGVLGTGCQQRQIMRTRQLRAPRRAQPMFCSQTMPLRSIGTRYRLATCSGAQRPFCGPKPLWRASSPADRQPASPTPSSATNECQA